MKKQFTVRRLALVLGMISALAGCHRDPNVRKQKFLERGQSYFAQGKYREAGLEFRNAMQIDPRFAQAHYEMAQCYLRLQQWAPAYQELGRTIELEPDNYSAHLDIANLLIAARQFKQAQEHTDLLLERQPNDAKVHLAVAAMLGGQGDTGAALKEAQQAIALAPDQSDPYLTLAALQLRLGQPDQAGEALRKAVELAPASVPAQLALAGFYQSRGQFAEAEQQLTHAIAISPKSPDLRAALVKLYAGQGRTADAEKVAQQAKQDLTDTSAGYRILGDYYFASGDMDRATNEYTTLYRDHPADLQVKKNYIQLLILKDRLDEASKLNDEVLKESGKDPEALVYRAQVQLRQGKPNEAVNTLQDAISSDPSSGVAHYHLGVAFDQQGNRVRAAAEWRNAISLRPDLVEAYRALAALALTNGDMSSLEQAAGQIIQLRPGSPEGYLLRALASMNRRMFPNAESDIRKAIELAPQNAAAYVQMGNFNLVQKNYAEAGKWYQQGLDRDPGSADALGGVMNSWLAQKQVDKAIAAANYQIVKVPGSSTFYDLLGTALFNNKKDTAGAEAAFNKALELDPNNADALAKLSQILVARGSTDEAIARYQKAIQENPRETGYYILLGELYETRQDFNNAKLMYQKALDQRPNNPLAANNLAYVTVQTGGNLDTALSLAQIARKGLSDSPNVADTLGWVYYQKGVYRSAIDLFEESLKLAQKAGQPENPNVHYHLGLAYDKAGNSALAKQHLQRVLKINPQYRDAAEVRKLLNQIG